MGGVLREADLLRQVPGLRFTGADNL